MAPHPHPAVSPEAARRLADSFADGLSDRSAAFTPASLEHADSSLNGDHLMAGMGMLDAARHAAGVDVAHRAGCYLGEVIVRALGGRWRPAAETEYAKLFGSARFPLVVQLTDGRCCNPLARPFKLLEHGREGESLAGFYAGIASPAEG